MAISALLGAASKCTIGQVAVDGVVAELHATAADMTEHTVESGGQVSDHYRKRPDSLSITAIISRTPIAVGFPGQTAINSVNNLIAGTDPVTAAWEELYKYMVEATDIPVNTGKKFYPSMLIVDLQDPREVNDWMRFNITMREYVTAYTDSVEALVKAQEVAATKVAQKQKNKGAQAAAEAENASILATLLGL
jgi:hypothetical protein